MLKRYITFLLPLFLLLSSCMEMESGKVIKVYDGDTIHVDSYGEIIKVRLYGIDAPEKKQAFGKKSAQDLAKAIMGKEVTIQVMDVDRYGRTVGIVYYEGYNINEEMIAGGRAWVYEEYCKEEPWRTSWLLLQTKARRERKGLWAAKRPLAPWTYRKRLRKKR